MYTLSTPPIGFETSMMVVGVIAAVVLIGFPKFVGWIMDK